MNKKIDSLINNEYKNLDNKNVVLTGANGGLGFYIAKYLARLNANLYITVRSIDKGEEAKNLILKEYPKSNINILILDLTNIDSVNNFINNVNKINIHYFIHNAGVYHVKTNINDKGIDITSLVNYLMPAYITLKLKDNIINNNGKFIYQTSISTHYIKHCNLEDYQYIKNKNLFYRYANSKYLITNFALYLKENNIPIEFSHPGIAMTKLFDKSRKNFNVLFYYTIVPFMRLMFMKPDKACLSTLSALNNKSNNNEWYGPRGLFQSWGYPKCIKLKKNLLNNSEHKLIYEKTIEILNEKYNLNYK